MTDPWKLVADGLVIGVGMKLMFTPIAAILSGELYGPEAFVGGVFIVGSIMFVEMYFRDWDEA
jgi:hypothetical protein